MAVTARYDRYLALAEQALVSGSNFLLYVFATRSLPKEQWGALSMALAVLLVVQGFQRAFVTLPMSSSGDDKASFIGTNLLFWRQVQVVMIALTMPVIGVAYLVAWQVGVEWVQQCVAMTAALLIPMYYLEFTRRVVILGGSMKRLFVMATAYAVVLGAASLIAYAMDMAHEMTTFVGILMLAAVCSCCCGDVNILPSAKSVVNANWSSAALWDFGKWSAGSSVAYSGYNFAVQAILAAVAGPAAVAVFAATRNLVQPINVVIQAMDSVDKPRAARALKEHGMAGLWGVTKKAWLWLAAVSLPYFLIVGFAAEPLLGLIYADKYAGASSSVLFWFLVMAVMIVVQPVESALYVLRRPKQLFYSRLFACLAVLGAAPFVVSHWSVNGALSMLALGWVIAGLASACVLWKAAQHMERM